MTITHHPPTRSSIRTGVDTHAPSTRAILSAFAPTAIGICLVLALCTLLGALFGAAIFAEGKAIETTSALAYGAAALTCAAIALRSASRDDAPSHRIVHDRLLGAALLALLCARELDMHRASPIGSLTRSASYVNPDVPLAWRLLAALAVLSVVAVAATFAWRAFGRWRRGALPLDHRVAGVVAAVATLGVAKGLDGIGRKLGDVGIATGARFDAAMMGVEESLELAASLVLLAVAVGLFACPTGGTTPPEVQRP